LSRRDREILRLAVPALGSLAIEPLVSLVDTAFVGRLGTEELAGLGIGGAAFLWAYFGFIFLSYATTPLVAGAVGGGDLDRARRATATAFVVGAVAGVAVWGLIELVAGPAVRLIGASGGAVDEALTYLRIRAVAAPAVMVVLAGNGAFRGYQDTRTPFVIVMAFNVVNFVLDPILIFGLNWGIAGAAWASVAAQVVGAVAFVVVAQRRHLVSFERGAFRLHEMRSFLSAGAGLGVRTIALLSVFTGATAVAARSGEESVAAYRVVDQVFLFLALSVDSLAVAAQALIGKHLGRSDRGEASSVARRLFVMGLGIGLALVGLLALLRPVLPGWFTSEVVVVEAIGSIYWFLVVLQPLMAMVFVGDGVLLGWSAFRYLAVSTVASAAAAWTVLVVVLLADLGLVGVYLGLTTLMVGRGIALRLWYRRNRALARSVRE